LDTVPKGGGAALLRSLNFATQRLLHRLCARISFPDKPVTLKQVSKAERNAEIRARHAAGESLKEFATLYGISPAHPSDFSFATEMRWLISVGDLLLLKQPFTPQ
jgi:hypothetical protein